MQMDCPIQQNFQPLGMRVTLQLDVNVTPIEGPY